MQIPDKTQLTEPFKALKKYGSPGKKGLTVPHFIDIIKLRCFAFCFREKWRRERAGCKGRKGDKMYYLGVDLGTSSVKLVLMESNGAIVKTASREYGLSFPKPGWSEQNPEDWFAGFESGLSEVLDGLDRSSLAGISFGGQMHGLVMLDENDKVIRPAILWNDGRTQEECDYLNKTIGREKISSYTANMALTGFTAPKILWVKKNEPDNFAKIKKIMLPKD